jgi:hypothetical protein
MKIDFDKPYGTVTGDTKVAYEQDGKFFDINGDEMEADFEEDHEAFPIFTFADDEPQEGKEEGKPIAKKAKANAAKTDNTGSAG